MSSELKTNKISPATSTTVTLGDASDTFVIPASATLDVNGTIDVTGATVTGLTTGKILQVLQATKTDTETTTSGTFVDITDLTVDITPAATSSKILIFANVLCIGTVAASAGWTRIARDGTGIAIADAAGSRGRTSAMGYSPGDGDTRHHSTVWLDSPSTTSQITYSAQFMTAAGAGTAYINRFENNTDGTGYGRGVSSITVMEVGA